MKIVIIGRQDSPNNQDLQREFEALGHSVVITRVVNVQLLTSEDGITAFAQGEQIDNADIYIFRGYNKSFWYAQILAEHFESKRGFVIDSILTKRLVPSKLFEATVFQKNGIPHPKTMAVLDTGDISALEQLTFPVIIKPIYGEQGKDMFIASSLDELPEEYIAEPGKYIVQEKKEIQSDVRVFVIGGKAIAASERHLIPGDFRTNASLGAKVTKFDLTPEVTELAEKAAIAIGYDIAGVDILRGDNEELFVIEVNTTPQWQTLQEQNQINVAQEIIKYIMMKYEERRI